MRVPTWPSSHVGPNPDHLALRSITGTPAEQSARLPALNNHSVIRHTDRIVSRARKERRKPPTPFSREAARNAALERIYSVLIEREPRIETGEASAHDVRLWLGVGWDIANKLLKDDRYDPPLSTLLQIAHALDLASIEELLGPLPLAEVLEAGRRSA